MWVPSLRCYLSWRFNGCNLVSRLILTERKLISLWYLVGRLHASKPNADIKSDLRTLRHRSLNPFQLSSAVSLTSFKSTQTY
jgi:hypothetical protein